MGKKWVVENSWFIQKRGEKEKPRNKEEMGQIENKLCDGSLKPIINDHINCKWTRYSK